MTTTDHTDPITGIAISGVGQTTYRRRHAETSTAGLMWGAMKPAVDEAGVALRDVDAFVIGVAPDALSGVNCPEKSSFFCPVDRPVIRVNTGGLTGGSAFMLAVTLVASGQAKTVVALALERMGQATTSQKVFNTIFDPIYEKDIALSTLTMCALRASMLMQRYGFTTDHWARIAERNYAHAIDNPYAQVRKRITAAEVRASKMLSWPLRQYEGCPMSEGACAVVVTSEPRHAQPAWVRGMGSYTDTYAMGDRMHREEGTMVDMVSLKRASARAYAQAGITAPRDAFDVVEIHAPFSSAEAMAYAPLGLCTPEGGPAFVEESLAGEHRMRINPSGGPQAANPVSATGLVRVAECASQVMGTATDRQVDGARWALATSQGGATQFSMAAVLSSDAA
jgi:acetyl-CoA C-acetyltransferase